MCAPHLKIAVDLNILTCLLPAPDNTRAGSRLERRSRPVALRVPATLTLGTLGWGSGSHGLVQRRPPWCAKCSSVVLFLHRRPHRPRCLRPLLLSSVRVMHMPTQPGPQRTGGKPRTRALVVALRLLLLQCKGKGKSVPERVERFHVRRLLRPPGAGLGNRRPYYGTCRLPTRADAPRTFVEQPRRAGFR